MKATFHGHACFLLEGDGIAQVIAVTFELAQFCADKEIGRAHV